MEAYSISYPSLILLLLLLLLLLSPARLRSQRQVRPTPRGEEVDLGSKFGLNVGSSSDSSDAEFAPEQEKVDSEGMAVGL